MRIRLANISLRCESAAGSELPARYDTRGFRQGARKVSATVSMAENRGEVESSPGGGKHRPQAEAGNRFRAGSVEMSLPRRRGASRQIFHPSSGPLRANKYRPQNRTCFCQSRTCQSKLKGWNRSPRRAHRTAESRGPKSPSRRAADWPYTKAHPRKGCDPSCRFPPNRSGSSSSTRSC